MYFKRILVLTFLCVNISCGHTTQRPSRDDDSNPFLDMASTFLQDALTNQGNNGGSGLAGIASIVGTLMQPGGSGEKSQSGAAQIISGLGSLIAASNAGNGGGGGFDPSVISNVIDMFTTSDDEPQHRSKRNDDEPHQENEAGTGLDSILQIASTLLSSQNQRKSRNSKENSLLNFLPMIMQVVSSFNGPEGQRTQEKHRDHAWVLPPFLEQIHVLWDHFSSSDLAAALWQKSGVHAIFQGFTGRDGKLDYDKLLESFHNQAFRRRWIRAATFYLADWANYIADPEVYQRYIQSAQMMFNHFLMSQGYPKTTFFDPARPSETISNLFDHVAKKHLNVKIESRTYVKPAVNYAKELLKLGQARGLLKKFNATELSDKLTDTVNLEIIEPVLKLHRAYHFAIKTPQCDKYVLCQLNSHDPNEKLGLAGFKPGAIKFGSMAAAWAMSSETGTPFWTLFSIINDPYNCEARFPVDCTGFHEGEAKVTTEYIHNEL